MALALRRALAAGLLAAAPLSSFGADGPSSLDQTAPARAENWILTLFTKDSYLSMRLSGSEVEPIGDDRIDLRDMNITVFSGDPSNRVDTILLSSQAIYFPHEMRATGTGGVRVIRNDCEITGEDWSYEQEGKKVSIHRRVHVVYQEPLKAAAP
jgi:hypothetical protein